VHPRGAALRPGGRAPPSRHGGGRRHAQQQLDYAPGAHAPPAYLVPNRAGALGRTMHEEASPTAVVREPSGNDASISDVEPR
jgi:hypothetical protein